MFLIVTIRIARRKGFIVCEAEYLLPIHFLPGRFFWLRFRDSGVRTHSGWPRHG